MAYLISGIQQLGVGVRSKEDAWKWYRKFFGMDVPIFQEAADAPLMTQYTGKKVQSRDAALALNLKGGSGFEIWQYTSRVTAYPAEALTIGDLGIQIGKIKTPDAKACLEYYKKEGVEILTELQKDPAGHLHFHVKDPWGNIFEMCERKDFFMSKAALTGGPFGAVVGVSDIDKVVPLYELLGYDTVLCDESGTFKDLHGLPGGDQKFRRVLLSHKDKRQGAFSRVFGDSVIELIQSLDRKGEQIFKDRYWGDAGFIHLCFDINGMNDLGKTLADAGYPFTVDSESSFDMGEAAGRFTYIEDPDGTLLEFVETHKVPIMKKINWYLNLKGRNPAKPLADWIMKLLGLGRIRD
ncbi:MULTISPECIES: VOC family protein [unclassified Oceanispirochaeta]|uniref:VOC family protein n=1 Tax=unclassified Oceanispirochaeta TaxID=2635722 RepID=UPI000E09A1C3|nr:MULTISPECIES: VOC family protein [unclassified Oceanispirochaeta]MBF9015781.1 VOC family protein [Oceanispirochaeta sp. M2]NPD72244.1 VOC family protein [Oceanispirochaeta sp. M1]RDG32341.1 VOC family protein [Oceanispirochaeta sp. M1]